MNQPEKTNGHKTLPAGERGQRPTHGESSENLIWVTIGPLNREKMGQHKTLPDFKIPVGRGFQLHKT